MSDTLLKRYRGARTEYVDVASRNDGAEILGLNLQYDVAGNGIGFITARFTVRSDSGKFEPFTHFTRRSVGSTFNDVVTGDVVPGKHLNKIPIPVIAPGVSAAQFPATADALGLWDPLVFWLTDQMVADGFVPLVEDLTALVKAELGAGPVNTPAITVLLEFPDLKAYKASHGEHAEYTGPGPGSGGESSVDDTDDEDEDGDEEDDGYFQ